MRHRPRLAHPTRLPPRPRLPRRGDGDGTRGAADRRGRRGLRRGERDGPGRHSGAVSTVPVIGGMGHAGDMSRYAEARLYVLPESLEELEGPTEGAVRLPRHIDWGPAYEYELADASDLAVMYERVLREARSREDLRAHLDGNTLRRLWGRLVLPAPLRALWERRFPELVTRRSAAA
ncbi:conserved hypothetical protein [Streptomyces sp. SPB78]|nr:conserved hypothetical protein [Streptomyces sp. SPB78]